MHSLASHQDRDRPRLRVAAIAAAVLAFTILLGFAVSADARRAKELGKTKSTPAPNCSGESPDECQITGQVTGFQRAADGRSNLFKAKERGRVVAWSVDLARPSKEEREVFGQYAKTERYGEAPTAGVGIIRKVGNGKFKLLRHSPILKVGSYYGERPYFTLAKPLRMRKGDIAALTTATWLPAFSIKGQGPKDIWVASRGKKNCELPSPPPEDPLEYFFSHTRPHTKEGSTRPYKCKYDGARLLYWAYFDARN